jgi:hypothetical protein
LYRVFPPFPQQIQEAGSSTRFARSEGWGNQAIITEAVITNAVISEAVITKAVVSVRIDLAL